MNTARPLNENTDTALLVYVLNLVSVLAGVTALIGLALIFLERGKPTPPWIQSHYFFQILTFFKSILFFVIGLILIPVFLGYLVLVGLLVWWLWRNIKGLRLLRAREAIPNPHTWLW